MLYLTLANERQRRQFQHDGGPLEFGRGPQRELPRVVVEDPFTSRDQLRIEELPDSRVKVVNLGSPITLGDGSPMASGQTITLLAPTRIRFGYTTLEISAAELDAASSLMSLARPARHRTVDKVGTRVVAHEGEAPSIETLTSWFETLLQVQRSAAGSDKFYAETASAVVELVGLDRALVLLREGQEWKIVASHGSTLERLAGQFSRRILHEMLTTRETKYESFSQLGNCSLDGIEAVVASPVFSDEDEVIGAVYGSRDMRLTGRRGIHSLEAQFVQLLAGAVSAGLARVASEAEVARARVQFEQFFSPELATALERDAGILAAEQRELTLLFADLRGFSKISERIGAAATFDLLADILDRLTNQVMDHGGVVIDYYGDGLAAMWNAPFEQPNHAELAAWAALAMLDELPAINVTWAERLGGLVRLGIGLNTGLSQVGNAGSRRRLKYGPRGPAVNLASRVEAATKLLGVACLVTESTRAQLPAEFPLRRLCRGRMSGIVEPVTLYELASMPPPHNWHAQRELYERALALYEEGNVPDCLALCEQLSVTADSPTRLLLANAQSCSDHVPHDPVFSLETK